MISTVCRLVGRTNKPNKTKKPNKKGKTNKGAKQAKKSKFLFKICGIAVLCNK